MIKFLLIFLFVCHCHNVLSSRIFLSFVFTSPLFLPSLPTPFFLSHLFFFSLSFFFLSLKERYGTKIDSRIPFFILSLSFLPPFFFSFASVAPCLCSCPIQPLMLLCYLWHQLTGFSGLKLEVFHTYLLLFFFWSCNMVILEATQLPPNVRVGDKYREWAPWSQS